MYNTKIDYRTKYGKLLKKELSKEQPPQNEKFPCVVACMSYNAYDRLININKLNVN